MWLMKTRTCLVVVAAGVFCFAADTKPPNLPPERQLDRQILALLAAQSAVIVRGHVVRPNLMQTRYGMVINERMPFEVSVTSVLRGPCTNGQVLTVGVNARDLRVEYKTNCAYLFFLKPYVQSDTNRVPFTRPQYRAVADYFGIIPGTGIDAEILPE